MKQINVGIIGTGWCGGIRANTCARYPSVDELHIAETNPERLAEVASETGAASAVATRRHVSSTVPSITSPAADFRRYFISQIWWEMAETAVIYQPLSSGGRK